MYFLPLLLGLSTFLFYPSFVLAGAVAFATWCYFIFAGDTPSSGGSNTIRGQIAYRMLSVKLLSLNGDMTDDTYEVHSLLTPDQAETSELRGALRNAGHSSGDGWKHWARVVKSCYNDPLHILDRYESLVIQLRASATGITHDSQDRLIEIGKLWGIGPNKARACLAKLKTTPSPNMAAW